MYARAHIGQVRAGQYKLPDHLDTARLIGNAVRAQLRAGAYDTLTTPARFAEVVTRHLQAINGDRQAAWS
ncbi:MAG: hypothetical protein ACREMA_20295 [Longimicrobiales bacterium]